MLDASQNVLSSEHPVAVIHYSSRIFVVRKRAMGDVWLVECVRSASAQVAVRLEIREQVCVVSAEESHMVHDRDAKVVLTLADRHHPTGDPLLELVFECHCRIEGMKE